MKTIRQAREAADLEFAKDFLDQNCIDSNIVFEQSTGGFKYAVLQVEDGVCEEALKILNALDAMPKATPQEKSGNEDEMSEAERQRLLRELEGIQRRQAQRGIGRALGILLRMFLG